MAYLQCPNLEHCPGKPSLFENQRAIARQSRRCVFVWAVGSALSGVLRRRDKALKEIQVVDLSKLHEGPRFQRFLHFCVSFLFFYLLQTAHRLFAAPLVQAKVISKRCFEAHPLSCLLSRETMTRFSRCSVRQPSVSTTSLGPTPLSWPGHQHTHTHTHMHT